MNKDITTVLLNLKNQTIQKPSFMTDQQQKFWFSLSKQDIIQISNIILQPNNENFSKLNKYSINEIDYIFNMFPLEIINKNIKSLMNELDKYYVYSLADYKLYQLNQQLIKNIKQYKKIRIKQENKKDK